MGHRRPPYYTEENRLKYGPKTEVPQILFYSTDIFINFITRKCNHALIAMISAPD